MGMRETVLQEALETIPYGGTDRLGDYPISARQRRVLELIGPHGGYWTPGVGYHGAAEIQQRRMAVVAAAEGAPTQPLHLPREIVEEIAKMAFSLSKRDKAAMDLFED
jgi:hypothetical protein